MSESEMERSDDMVDLVGDGDDDQGYDSKQKGQGCSNNYRKAKKVALFRFRKVDKQPRRKNKKASVPPPYSSPGRFSRRVGGSGRGGGIGSCYACFKQTPTLDSPVESQTSDPNSEEFGFELLRALIEKNDFYSKECNPHLDTDGTSEA